MSMLHPAATFEESELVLNPVYPLVREMAHKYGLMALWASPKDDAPPSGRRFALCRDDGFPVCHVYYSAGDKTFNIRNIMVQKERGRTRNDKSTFSASKVPVLMRTIVKKKLIPADTGMVVTEFDTFFKQVPQQIINSYGRTYKSTNLDTGTIHELLSAAIYRQGLNTSSASLYIKCKEELDRLNKLDDIKSLRDKEIADMFRTPFYAIAYDSTNTFLVGKIAMQFDTATGSDITNYQIALGESFKRVKNIMDIPELVPRMAMLKTKMLSLNPHTSFTGEGEFFPQNYEGYIDELRIAGVTGAYRNDFLLKPDWLFVL